MCQGSWWEHAGLLSTPHWLHVWHSSSRILFGGQTRNQPFREGRFSVSLFLFGPHFAPSILVPADEWSDQATECFEIQVLVLLEHFQAVVASGSLVPALSAVREQAKSYLEKYKPASMSFSLAAIRREFRSMYPPFASARNAPGEATPWYGSWQTGLPPWCESGPQG